MIQKIIVIIFLAFPISIYGQIDTVAIKTIKGITNKMLELISVDIGEEVNWDAYRNLFLPTAQKISVNPNAPKGHQVRSRNLEEFVRAAGPSYPRDGFEEYAIGLEVNEFNGVANAFQSFYCKNLTGTYEKRGVNNYLLVWADDRWWIAATIYSNETENSPLPDDLIDVEFRSKK